MYRYELGLQGFYYFHRIRDFPAPYATRVQDRIFACVLLPPFAGHGSSLRGQPMPAVTTQSHRRCKNQEEMHSAPNAYPARAKIMAGEPGNMDRPRRIDLQRAPACGKWRSLVLSALCFPAPQSTRGHFKVPAQIFNSPAIIATVYSLLELQYFDFRSNIINYTRLCTTVVSGSCLILLFHFCRTALLVPVQKPNTFLEPRRSLPADVYSTETFT